MPPWAAQSQEKGQNVGIRCFLLPYIIILCDVSVERVGGSFRSIEKSKGTQFNV